MLLPITAARKLATVINFAAHVVSVSLSGRPLSHHRSTEELAGAGDTAQARRNNGTVVTM